MSITVRQSRDKVTVRDNIQSTHVLRALCGTVGYTLLYYELLVTRYLHRGVDDNSVPRAVDDSIQRQPKLEMNRCLI